ncbi:MAG: hypothetical protein R3C19_07610 [Planctomycetaceae bacterium]
MRKLLLLLALCCLPCAATGCQCCSLTERYCDLIDDVAYPNVCCERWYHSKLDLTRINMPDGIQCCPGGGCCNCCR